jgi:hypothetical protein
LDFKGFIKANPINLAYTIATIVLTIVLSLAAVEAKGIVSALCGGTAGLLVLVYVVIVWFLSNLHIS